MIIEHLPAVVRHCSLSTPSLYYVTNHLDGRDKDTIAVVRSTCNAPLPLNNKCYWVWNTLSQNLQLSMWASMPLAIGLRIR